MRLMSGAAVDSFLIFRKTNKILSESLTESLKAYIFRV